MFNGILPTYLDRALSALDFGRLFELRLRAARPAVVDYGGVRYYLGACGICRDPRDAFVCTSETLGSILLRAAEYSLYRAASQLAEGFLTMAGGVRIGICGEAFEGGAGGLVRSVGSLVIRVPHAVEGCSDGLSADGSLLILGAPGLGKTTLLRDLARRLSKKHLNVVVVDERCEIAACADGIPALDVGECDVVSHCTKLFGMTQAVRAMRPDVVVTDELVEREDFAAVRRCVESGVRVMASLHGTDAAAARERLRALDADVFDRIAVLGQEPGRIVESAECVRGAA